MKDISIYFQPISQTLDFDDEQLGSVIESYTNEFPVLIPNTCAIIYVPEFFIV